MPTGQAGQSGISLSELADELQCHKQTLFKLVKRLGIIPTKHRDPDRGNQLVSVITAEEALSVRREILSRGNSATEAGVDEEISVAETGRFYLIQLEPEHDPGRIKLGFTTDTDERLRKHRCAAPFAKYVRTWPCKPLWERTAMDCITDGLERLHTEVFRAPDLELVLHRASSFFALMPAVHEEIQD